MLILGRLGKDPELKQASNNKSYVNMTVATDVSYGDKKQTTWFMCRAGGKLADACSKYLKKGSKVFIDGFITQYQPEPNKTYWNVDIETIKFLDPKQDTNSGQQGGFGDAPSGF